MARNSFRLAAISASLLFAAPLAAQTLPAAPSAAPAARAISLQEDVLVAMEEGVDQGAMFAGIVRSIRTAWENHPNMVMAEKAHPGLMDAMLDAAMPVLKSNNDELSKVFRPRQIAAIAGVLNNDEARDAAAFYRSALGRKMLGAMSEKVDFANTISDAMQNKGVSEQSVRSDLNGQTARALATLNQADFEELRRLSAAKPALLKLEAVGNALVKVRTEMEQAAMQPPYQERMAAAMSAAAQHHIGKK